mmetsp:Transcript_125683/g.268182  ORF Transcript_125683/g.268182 Transcript_125683/m.268182 type:complete len:167 (-) Transcript_125683:117-617(-)
MRLLARRLHQSAGVAGRSFGRRIAASALSRCASVAYGSRDAAGPSCASTGPPEEPDNCCGSQCDPCVWEVYYQDLKDYQKGFFKATPAMQASCKALSRTADDIEPGDHARLRNLRSKRGRAMNGLIVEILEPDKRLPGLWTVMPVGVDKRMSFIPANLELQPHRRR